MEIQKLLQEEKKETKKVLCPNYFSIITRALADDNIEYQFAIQILVKIRNKIVE